MRAPAGAVNVHQRNVDLGIGGAARVGETEIAFGADRRAVEIAEMRGADEGRSVFLFAVDPGHRRLAIGLDLVRPAGQGDDAFGQELAEDGCEATDFGLEVFDVAACRPGVLD